jgi:hypothetical protein
VSVAGALLEGRIDRPLGLVDGIVSTGSPLTIIVPPSTVASPATALDSYHPNTGDFVQVLVQGANRLVLGRAAASYNDHVGWRSYTRKPSDTSGITSGITAVIEPAALTMIAGRRYRFTIEMLLFTSSPAVDNIAFYLRNVGDGLTYRRWLTGGLSAGFQSLVVTHVTETSLAGSATWRVDIVRLSGSGSITVYGFASTTPHATPESAPRYSSLLIEDIGPL